MNTLAAQSDSAPARLQRQLWLVAALALLAGATMVLPLGDWQVPRLHYLPIHTLLEFLSIMVAFLVFANVWHTPTQLVAPALVLIATTLFAAGWVDFAHTLSFNGMPDVITPSSATKSIAFWMVARFLVALVLLVVSFFTFTKPLSGWQRHAVLWANMALVLLVFLGVVFYEAQLPVLFTPQVGLSPLKVALEWGITGMLATAALRFYWLALRSSQETLPLLFSASAVAALGELFLAYYTVSNDATNLLGHLYKIVSYGLMYQAVFIVNVRKPYQLVSQQASNLMAANQRLRFQSLALESTANPIQVTDLAGQVTWNNRASRKLIEQLGLGANTQMNIFESPATPDPAMARDMRETLAQGRVWRGFVYLQSARTDTVVLDRFAAPIRNEQGQVEGYVVTSKNVTDNITAQSRHKRVIETALDGFCVLDPQGHVLEVNDAYCRMSGFAAQELLGLHVSALDALHSQPGIRGHLQAIAEGQSDQFETRHRHKNGSDFPVDVSVAFEPKWQQFFVFVRDRSERVAAAQAKRGLEQQLQQSQKIQALGQLTSGIAHDFNNILATVLGYSNLALDRFVPDKQSKLAHYLHEVVAASERARDLVARMLIFARSSAPDSPQGPLQTPLIAPDQVVREFVAMVRPSIPASIGLDYACEAEAPVHIDAGELHQILMNLVINARDALGEYGRIGIRMRRVQRSEQVCTSTRKPLQGEFLAIEVADTGAGMTAAQMAHIFEPFYTTKDVGKGTGLGLSMVQGILMRCGAFVVVQSEPGQGSVFELLFPLPDPGLAGAVHPPEQAPVLPGAGQCIWVLDDEVPIARYLCELLQGAGYRARSFESPQAVLQALQVPEPDVALLLTDQTMPGLSGTDLVARIRMVLPGLPILVCTGAAADTTLRALVDQPQVQVLAKPVPAHTLLQALARALTTV